VLAKLLELHNRCSFGVRSCTYEKISPSISGYAVPNEMAKCFGGLNNALLYDYMIFCKNLHSMSKTDAFLDKL